MSNDVTFSERLAALLGKTRTDVGNTGPKRGVTRGDEEGFSGRLQAELGRRRTATPAPPPVDAGSRVTTLPGETRSTGAGVEAPADLSEVVRSWSSLAPAVRASIVSIVRASRPT